MKPRRDVLFAACLLMLAWNVSSLEGRPDTETRDYRNPRSCGEAEMCCSGQNNTCFVFGHRVDRSTDSDRCYCDANCLIMGDCCMDYAHVCKAQDCTVMEWSEWTECDNPCGYGTRRRTRKVDAYPENGGKHCPVLKQRRACVGFDEEFCRQLNVEHQKEELQEVGRILPSEYGQYRSMKKYDPWKGILKNLYDRYFNQIFTRATYCAKYVIKHTSKHCQDTEWAAPLKEETRLCVECQPVAMNRDIGMRCMGHGVFGKVTAWKAVDVKHCHGTWEMVQQHEPCTCNAEVEPSFIFI